MRRSTQKRKVPVRLEDHDQPTTHNRRSTPRAQIPPPHEITIPKAATAMIPSADTPPPRPPTSARRAHTSLAGQYIPKSRAPTHLATPPTPTQIAPTPTAKERTCTRRTLTHPAWAPTPPPMTTIQQQEDMVQQLAEKQGKKHPILSVKVLEGGCALKKL
jgi:hypothetical protein